DEVALGLSDDLHITIPRGSYKQLNALMDVDASIEAPVNKGEQLGVVRITLNDEKLSAVPLVALQRIENGNLFQVAKDYILQLFN
ncbi:MAG: serine-type D-Ala-D-Ala carboxypeptidase, partial [Gammaproteobacteria bacterium]|nr:serine-type D-Ala-D-Ala carboxypeptidase [Gammaproteobacteria bacterium]